ncbi:FAD binding domain-containing protein [Microbacteriaceae bacterium K1510]|nr:FAD binding domain-containing protein [Microbacteriaceae bacterium K1510]
MDLNTITEVVQPQGRAELPAWREGDAFLAGGTWLFSEPQPHLRRLIDLPGLRLEPLHVTSAGLTIAATCTIAQLESFALPAPWTVKPLIEQCCRAFLASFKIWNMATVGGNLCMSLPAGPMISLTTALDGKCVIWSADGSERRVPVIDFVLGPQRNVLQRGELLRQIDLPGTALTRRTAFRQISLSPFGRSAALLIGTRAPDSSTLTLTITASTPHPVQLAFETMPSATALRARIEDELPPGAYYNDVHGAPDWRRAMTLTFAEEIRDELADAR